MDALNLEFLFDPDPNSLYGIPMLKPCNTIPSGLVQFGIGKKILDDIKPEDRVAMHFFLDDYRFERVWKNPLKYSAYPLKSGIALTPDFSIWSDMPLALQIYNTYRNRLIGALWQAMGIDVIPTISWTHPFNDLCLDGVPKHSTIAISLVGVSDKDHKYFMHGLNKICEKLEPQNIVCYGSIHKNRMIFGLKPKIYEFPTRWDIIEANRR